MTPPASATVEANVSAAPIASAESTRQLLRWFTPASLRRIAALVHDRSATPAGSKACDRKPSFAMSTLIQAFA
jgi:hypothetical protein